MTRGNLSRTLLGVILVGIGVALLGATFGLWEFDLFFDGWWTLFLIVPAVISMLSGGISTGNVVLLVIGGALLLREQKILPNLFSFQFILALVFLSIGVIYLFGHGGYRRPYAEGKQNAEGDFSNPAPGADHFDYPNYFVCFGGSAVRNACRDLKGGHFTAVFGGLDIDLSDATLRQDITVQAIAIFGGIDIKAPRNAVVRATGLPLFGGFSDESPKLHADEPLYSITVNYTALFGGVEMK